MKLLIRGGSISAGYGVTRSYVDILRDYYAPRGLEIINRSRAKETSFDGILSFYDDIDPFRPEYLALHFGIDDAFSCVFRSEFKENLVQIIRLARARFDPTVVLLTSHVFDQPSDMDTANMYYRAIREVSIDLECEMIPVHIYWAGYLLGTGFRHADFVQQDSRYPNERGHEIIADAVIQRTDKILPLWSS
jgi:hypothetical protein